MVSGADEHRQIDQLPGDPHFFGIPGASLCVSGIGAEDLHLSEYYRTAQIHFSSSPAVLDVILGFCWRRWNILYSLVQLMQGIGGVVAPAVELGWTGLGSLNKGVPLTREAAERLRLCLAVGQSVSWTTVEFPVTPTIISGQSS
jgi:hypothetical protein